MDLKNKKKWKKNGKKNRSLSACFFFGQFNSSVYKEFPLKDGLLVLVFHDTRAQNAQSHQKKIIIRYHS